MLFFILIRYIVKRREKKIKGILRIRTQGIREGRPYKVYVGATLAVAQFAVVNGYKIR